MKASLESSFYFTIVISLFALFVGMVFLPGDPMVDMGEKYDFLPIIYTGLGFFGVLGSMVLAVLDLD